MLSVATADCVQQRAGAGASWLGKDDTEFFFVHYTLGIRRSMN